MTVFDMRANRDTLDVRELREYFRVPEATAAAPGGAGESAWINDPYARLDDLMCVVEALCPVWPERELRRAPVAGGFRL